jgi:hypothetical protein
MSATPLKLCVTGSRDCGGLIDATLATALDGVLADRPPVAELIHGDARGVDRMAGRWAHAKQVPVRIYRPKSFKRRECYLERDAKMVEDADVVVAFWNGSSTGTAYTMQAARKAGKLAATFVIGETGLLVRQ